MEVGSLSAKKRTVGRTNFILMILLCEVVQHSLIFRYSSGCPSVSSSGDRRNSGGRPEDHRRIRLGLLKGRSAGGAGAAGERERSSGSRVTLMLGAWSSCRGEPSGRHAAWRARLRWRLDSPFDTGAEENARIQKIDTACLRHESYSRRKL